jgi:hypothetical protein
MKNTSKADVLVFVRPDRVPFDKRSKAKFSISKRFATGAVAKDSLDSALEESSMAEAATALADFAVKAQMQGFGLSRQSAVRTLRNALDLISDET